MSPAREGRGRLLLALCAVWILWGSTYFAIRVAVEALPPFLMAGTRFVLAGALLLTYALATGAERPRREHLLPACVSGALLMLCSNGLVCWAETRVDSSVAALVVAGVPLWMLLFDWLRPRGARPAARGLAGVVVGMAGVALLAAPDPAHPLDPLGIAALVAATISWSIGSLYSRGAHLPRAQVTASGLQMLAGGILQCVAGVALGEVSRVDLELVGARHVASWAWLVLAGSIAGFSAYLWLLKHTTPALATSYAFVNPLVALVLGVVWGGEVLAPRTWIAAAIIVGAVVLVVTARRPSARAGS
ncbi:MAG: EamA family transporter [Planctomycetes bacterium]|nr:EamA family transporter [Planctomycetota bacterium]